MRATPRSGPCAISDRAVRLRWWIYTGRSVPFQLRKREPEEVNAPRALAVSRKGKGPARTLLKKRIRLNADVSERGPD